MYVRNETLRDQTTDGNGGDDTNVPNALLLISWTLTTAGDTAIDTQRKLKVNTTATCTTDGFLSDVTRTNE